MSLFQSVSHWFKQNLPKGLGGSQSVIGRQVAQDLYDRAVFQARAVEFYEKCGVPDTLNGRMDCVMLHTILLQRRLLRSATGPTAPLVDGGPAARDIAQHLVETMIEDLAFNLREAGVSDMRIGSQVKALARGFRGRAVSYDSALDTWLADPPSFESFARDAPLPAAISRNLYGDLDTKPLAEWLWAVSNYVAGSALALMDVPNTRLAAGYTDFVALPDPFLEKSKKKEPR